MRILREALRSEARSSSRSSLLSQSRSCHTTRTCWCRRAAMIGPDKAKRLLQSPQSTSRSTRWAPAASWPNRSLSMTWMLSRFVSAATAPLQSPRGSVIRLRSRGVETHRLTRGLISPSSINYWISRSSWMRLRKDSVKSICKRPTSINK